MIASNLANKSISVAFLGPDGSGKSTIIEGLLNENLPFKNNYYFHLKPLRKKHDQKSITVEDPHKYPPYGKLKSYLKLIVFIFQYNYGWIKNILPLKKESSLIIFDRYFDDMLVDYRRYRYGGSLKVAKCIGRLIPKPDYYFILTADSSIIYQRKKEVSIEELNRQILEYRKLADSTTYFDVDVSQSPAQIVSKISAIIQNK